VQHHKTKRFPEYPCTETTGNYIRKRQTNTTHSCLTDRDQKS